MEDLLDFAHWVAQQVCTDDDEWEATQTVFPEVACRKLVKLGIIKEKNEEYIYKPWENDHGTVHTEL